MMHPEIMHIIVNEHQKYLRTLWSDEPLLPDAGKTTGFVRRHLGKGLVRIGILLGGHAPTTAIPADLSPQQ